MKITHVEIPVLDIQKAKEFYSKAFGWDKKVMDEFGPDYLLAAPEQEQVSFGFYKVDKMPEKGTSVVMTVDDLDGTIKRFKADGIKFTREKFEIGPEIGFGAYFDDIFGNNWGLHTRPENK